MNRIVLAVALLLFAAGGDQAAAAPDTAQGSGRDGTASGRGEKNAPAKTLTCDWASADGSDEARLAEENAVKLALYEAVVSGKGVVKAKKDCATVEGDPLPIYATAKGGKIKVTYDYSRDRFMSFKGLIKSFGGGSYSTRKVEIGYLDRGKFIPLRGDAPKDRRLFLRLKGKEYF